MALSLPGTQGKQICAGGYSMAPSDTKHPAMSPQLDDMVNPQFFYIYLFFMSQNMTLKNLQNRYNEPLENIQPHSLTIIVFFHYLSNQKYKKLLNK